MATMPDGEEIVQRVNVGRDASDQAADGASIVEAHRQRLQTRENFLAHVVHCFLADVLHHAHLHVLHGETEQQGARQISVTMPRP